MTGANLWSADIRGADLTRAAILARCNLERVIADESTTLPDGSPYSPAVNWTCFTKGSGVAKQA